MTTREKHDRALRTPLTLTQEDFDRDEDPQLEPGPTAADAEFADPVQELNFSGGYKPHKDHFLYWALKR